MNVLTAPFVLGLATAGLSVLFRKLVTVRADAHSWYERVGVLLGLVLTALAGVFGTWYIALYVAVGSLLVMVSLTRQGRKLSTAVVAYASFFSMMAVGIFVLTWGIWRPPTQLERAEVTFSNGRTPVWLLDCGDLHNRLRCSPTRWPKWAVSGHRRCPRLPTRRRGQYPFRPHRRRLVSRPQAAARQV